MLVKLQCNLFVVVVGATREQWAFPLRMVVLIAVPTDAVITFSFAVSCPLSVAVSFRTVALVTSC